MGDRDENGRFLKGHTVRGNGPGRPSRAVESARLADFNKVITGAKWRKVVRKVLEMAENGDIQAIKLLFSYALGNPVQRVQTEIVETPELRDGFVQALERGYPPEVESDVGSN